MTKVQNKTKNNDGFSFADYTSFAQVLNVDVSVLCFMLAEINLQISNFQGFLGMR